jgi:hypothetical protein
VLNELIWDCPQINESAATLSACIGSASPIAVRNEIDITSFAKDIAARYQVGVPLFALVAISLVCGVTGASCIASVLGLRRGIYVLAPVVVAAVAFVALGLAGTNNVRSFIIDQTFASAGGVPYVERLAAEYHTLVKFTEKTAYAATILLFAAFGAVAVPPAAPGPATMRKRIMWLNTLIVVGIVMFVLMVLATRAYLAAPMFLVTDRDAAQALTKIARSLGSYWGALTSLMLALACFSTLIAVKLQVARLTRALLPAATEAVRRTWLEERGLYQSSRQLIARGFSILIPVISNTGFDVVQFDFNSLISFG